MSDCHWSVVAGDPLHISRGMILSNEESGGPLSRVVKKST